MLMADVAAIALTVWYHEWTMLSLWVVILMLQHMFKDEGKLT